MTTVLDRHRRKTKTIRWCPWQKVVLNQRTGEIDVARTNEERASRGLPVPWTPKIWFAEQESDPVV